MSKLENASLQHILISYSEYERLKSIEEEFNKMQNQVHQKLLIPSTYNEIIYLHKHITKNVFLIIFYIKLFSEQSTSKTLPAQHEPAIDESLNQTGSGESKAQKSDDEDFIQKVAYLVGEKLNPLLNARPVSTIWSNYDISLPSSSTFAAPNSTPPLRYNNTISKNDENDIFG
jgi:hypothetical protein